MLYLLLLSATVDGMFTMENLITIIGTLGILFVWKGKTDEKLKVVEMKIDKIEVSQEKLENLVTNIISLQKDIEYIKTTDSTQNEKLTLMEEDIKRIRDYSHKTNGSIQAIYELLKDKIKH